MKKAALTAALGLAGIGMVSSANASLVISLQGSGGGSSTSLNSATAVGTVIPLTIVATVTDSQGTPALDSFQAAIGSLLSKFTGAGAVEGNFSGVTFNSTFQASGAQSGTPQHLPDGAPGTDLGGDNSLNSGGAVANSGDYVVFRAGAAQTSATGTFTLGTVNFTVTKVDGAAQTNLLWEPEANSDASPIFGAATWREVTSASPATAVTQHPTTNTYAGTPYVISMTPEPGSLALAGLGALGLLGRRRRA